jgi:hypothetical protein
MNFSKYANAAISKLARRSLLAFGESDRLAPRSEAKTTEIRYLGSSISQFKISFYPVQHSPLGTKMAALQS